MSWLGNDFMRNLRLWRRRLVLWIYRIGAAKTAAWKTRTPVGAGHWEPEQPPLSGLSVKRGLSSLIFVPDFFRFSSRFSIPIFDSDFPILFSCGYRYVRFPSLPSDVSCGVCPKRPQR